MKKSGKIKQKKLATKLLAVVLAISTLINTIGTTGLVSAVALTKTPKTSAELATATTKLMYYYAMKTCYETRGLNTDAFYMNRVSVSDVNDGTWFFNDTTASLPAAYLYLKSTGSGAGQIGSGALSNSVSCDAKLVSEFVQAFSLQNPRNLFCMSGVKAYHNTWYSSEDELPDASCRDTGADVTYFKSTATEVKLNFNAINNYIKTNYYDGGNPLTYYSSDQSVYAEQIYQSYLKETFTAGCGASKALDQTSPEDTSVGRYLLYNARAGSPSGAEDSFNAKDSSGADITYGLYKEYYNSSAITTFKLTGATILKSDFKSTQWALCPDIMSSLSDINKSIFSKLKTLTATSPETPLDDTTTGGDLADESSSEKTAPDASTCNVESVGWIVCPVVKFLGKIADKAYGFIAKDFLVLDSGLLGKNETGGESSAKEAWKSVQTLANTAFIIAFLIIIFSQVTSLGISNYGIKKMLPKLIIAAILVNLSYYICQIAVDISNIVGSSINSYVTSFTPVKNEILTNADAIVIPTAAGPSQTGEGLAGVAGLVLVGGAIALIASLSTLIPILIGAVVACIMILLILVLRKALIVILTILSPLAFVAYMLPNTQKLFDRWKQTFISLLMVYPIVAFVFAASKLASAVLMPAYQDPDNLTDDYMIKQIIAAGVSVLPLFVVPGLLKKSLDGIAGVGAFVNKLGSGAQGVGKNASKKVSDKYENSGYVKFRRAQKAETKARINAGNYSGKNPFRKVRSNINSGVNNSRLGNLVTRGYGAEKDRAIRKQNKEDEKLADEIFNQDDVLMSKYASAGGDMGSDQFKELSEGQKSQWIKMNALKLHQKSSTYTSAAKYLSENGKGSGEDIWKALQNAKKNGASEKEFDDASGSALAALRSSGRADNMVQLDAHMQLDAQDYNAKHQREIDQGKIQKKKVETPMTLEQAFGKISTDKINKDIFADKTDDEKDRIKQSYVNTLIQDPNKLAEALQNYHKMDIRAQANMVPLIVKAAHTKANAGWTAGTPVIQINDIQTARKHFNVSG